MSNMNRRLALASLLAVVCGSAAAEWISVAIHDEPGSFVVYADPATIRRSGNLVKIWEIRNYTAPDVMDTGERYLSAKSQVEYDCAEGRQRSLFQAHFTGAMGNGNVVWMRSNPGEWFPLPPGSMGEIASKFACRKR